MIRLTIQLTITFDTALSIGAGGSAGTLADKSIIRDGWGRPLIPGSQVKGKLRWAVEQLLRGIGHDIPPPFDTNIEKHTLVRSLFGSPEYRSPLRFVDLPTTIVSPQQAHAMQQDLSQIRPSVSINRRRGTAEDQRLFFQEVAQEGMIFHSDRAITGDLPADMNAEHVAALLWTALKLTDRWGGAKSRGLGWAKVEPVVTLDTATIEETALVIALRGALIPQGDAQ